MAMLAVIGIAISNFQNHFQKTWLDVHTLTLQNGLQLVHMPNHRAPIAHVSVWYKAGAAHDPKGKEGLAHYMEHLMFRPPISDPAYNFSALIDQWGGSSNAFTSYDITSYFATIPSDKIDDYLAMEAARMRTLEPIRDQAETELSVILQERAQILDNQPSRLFGEQRNRFLFGDHPYGRSIIGTPDTISNFTYEDAINFHRDYYAPDNAVLLIAGDIKWSEARRLAQKHFGSVVSPQNPNRVIIPATQYTQDTFFRYCDARVRQTEWYLTFPLELENTSEEREQQSAVGALLASLLEFDPASPLYKRLIDDEELVSSYSVAYTTHFAQDRSVTIRLIPKDIYKDNRDIFDQIDLIIQDSVDDIETVQLKQTAQQLGLLYKMAADTPFSLAMSLGYEVAQGRSVKDIIREPERLFDVNLDDIHLFLKDRTAIKTALLPQTHPWCRL